MRVFGLAFLIAIAGYLVGVLLGVAVVHLFSSPKPDKGTEAVMTGFFVVGPGVAVLAFIGALLYLLHRPAG